MYLEVLKVKYILTRGYDINTFISDRAGRKSSVIQELMIEEALADRPFILLRSKKDENINENWLSEYVINKYPEYTFYSEKINSNIVALYFNTPDGIKHLYCYGLYLSLQKKYKSSYYEGFEKVCYIVWEECIENEPITQNIRYIRRYCMSEINAVLSIASTVSRYNRVQLIWLGNDIKQNILNPVTIGFNLLEELEKNLIKTGTAVFNDREYSYYFNYFDFPGAVNHWLYNENLHITNTIPADNVIKYDIILKTEYKQYYMYNCGSYVHISDKDYIQAARVKSQMNTAADFFKKWNAERLLNEYPINTALIMLCSFYGVPRTQIVRYFGPDWYKNPHTEFKPIIEEQRRVIIDLEKVINLPLSDILQLPEYNEIKNIYELKKATVMTFSNIKIMLLIEELSNILIFT